MPLGVDPPVSLEYAPDANLYDALGGREGCYRLASAFYAHVAQDPILRPLYPAHIKCSVGALATFLTQFLGGPYDYDGRPWSMSLHAAHQRFAIGPQERVAWLTDMFQAIDAIQTPEPARSALRWVFLHASADLVNRPQQTATVALSEDLLKAEQNAPEGSLLQQDIALRWEIHQMLEQVIVAIRQHEVDQALLLLESRLLQDLFRRERAAWLHPLALLIGSNQQSLLDYAEHQLIRDPALVTERYMGHRTLLHEIAGQGNVRMVAVLLRLGADPNAIDGYYRHTPLYCISNTYLSDGVAGAKIVSLLVQAGANVNVRDQVKQCTALHMAARRGNVSVAQALLRYGADIEAHDKNGDTPLHRAVKCGHADMVAFLLSQGADVQAKAKSGKTPWQMARGERMQQVLQP